MEIPIYENECIEDLQFDGLRIIQDNRGFRFGTDSILLAGFAKASKRERVIDLGSGNGVLSILINGRTGAKVVGVEIQPEQCERAARSVTLNGQSDIIFINGDMRSIHRTMGLGGFDVGICNPPYYAKEGGYISKKGTKGYDGVATHDIECGVTEVAEAASKLLKFGGRLYICYPTARLAEIITALSYSGLEPKRLRLVCSMSSKPPYLALIEAKKGGGKGMIVEKNLTVYAENGKYTDEVAAIYHM